LEGESPTTTAVRYVIIWILYQFKSVVELIDSLISSNQFYFFLAFNVFVIDMYSCSNYLFYSQLLRRAAVGYFIVDGCVDCWCIDVSWVWMIPNKNDDALLQNNNICNTLLHRGPTP
jgi:hypothetical protein